MSKLSFQFLKKSLIDKFFLLSTLFCHTIFLHILKFMISTGTASSYWLYCSADSNVWKSYRMWVYNFLRFSSTFSSVIFLCVTISTISLLVNSFFCYSRSKHWHHQSPVYFSATKKAYSSHVPLLFTTGFYVHLYG